MPASPRPTRRQFLGLLGLGLAGAAALAGAPAPDRRLPQEPWLFRDNDFDSLATMEQAHLPIVRLARPLLRRSPGPVLDLGAGNGALVDRICHEVPGCTPYGVELVPERASHARALCPAHGDQIVAGDMFGCQDLFGRDYALVLLMPGRLLDGPAEGCAWLRERLRDRARNLLVYAYDDWLERYGTLRHLAEAAGLRIADHHPQARAALARLA